MVYPTNKSSNLREVTLTLGDPGGDGHCQTEVVHFSTSASDEELKKAYSDSESLFGFSVRQVAEDYEVSHIEPARLSKFKFLGFTEPLEFESEVDDAEDNVVISTDDFVALFTFFVNKSLPEAKKLTRKDDHHTELTNLVGFHGYGLFGS